MNKNLTVVYIFLVSLLVSTQLLAFTNGVVGSVSLSVIRNGAPVSNTKIFVLSTTNPVYSYESNTDMNGNIVISDVPVGGILIKVMDANRNTLAEYTNNTVKEDEQLSLTLNLN